MTRAPGVGCVRGLRQGARRYAQKVTRTEVADLITDDQAAPPLGDHPTVKHDDRGMRELVQVARVVAERHEVGGRALLDPGESKVTARVPGAA